MIDLEELERLDNEATPGPWEEIVVCGSEYTGIYDVQMSANKKEIATFSTEDKWVEDMQLCVELRNAAPELIRMAKRAERYRKALEKIKELKNRFESEATFKNAQQIVDELRTVAREALAKDEEK